MNTFRAGIAAIALLLCAAPLFASADALGDLQAQIQGLLAQISTLQSENQTPSPPAAQAEVPIASPASCPVFLRTLSRGESGADVLALQQYLIAQGFLTGDSATGFFGPATESAVQAWQATHGIVSSGTPISTGYGVAGSRTRAAITSACATAAQTNPVQNPVTTSCPIAPQPSLPCAGTWSAVANTNGCTLYWQCSVPLPQLSASAASTSTSASSGMCAASPVQPSAACVLGTWQPTYAGSCESGWQCTPASSGPFSAVPMSGPSPLAVQFSVKSTSGTVIDFGDGQSGTPQEVCSGIGVCTLAISHTYSSSGTYAARLIAGPTILGNLTITVGQ
jgi:peptidoglycan hydrolase-like protein with peptidoglycan-binding domain